MMKLKIEIEMDNAAFEDNGKGQVAQILTSLAADMEAGNCLSDVGDHETLMDINGNACGKAKVTR